MFGNDRSCNNNFTSNNSLNSFDSPKTVYV